MSYSLLSTLPTPAVDLGDISWTITLLSLLGLKLCYSVAVMAILARVAQRQCLLRDTSPSSTA